MSTASSFSGAPASAAQEGGSPWTVLALASRLIIQVPAVFGRPLTTVCLTDRIGAEAFVSGGRWVAFRHGAAGAPVTCLSVDTFDLLEIDVASLVSARLTFVDGQSHEASVAVRTISDRGGIDAKLIALIQAASAAGAVDPRIGLIFDRSCRWLGAEAAGHLSLDRATPVTGATLIEGWIEHFDSREISLISADFRAFSSWENILSFYREDVVSHLASLPDSRAVAVEHGFIALLPGSSSVATDLYLVERDRSRVSMTGPLAVAQIGERSKALPFIRSKVATAEKSPERVARLVAPFARRARGKRKTVTKHFGPPAEDIRLSIVVPLERGDPVFIHAQLLNQAKAPPGVEWIFIGKVDWDLAGFLEQQTEIQCSTTIILLPSEDGLAFALNSAVEAALGRSLLVLNQSAWISDFAGLMSHISHLGDDGSIIVGLQGVLEDGSPAPVAWHFGDSDGVLVKSKTWRSPATAAVYNRLPDGTFLSLDGMLAQTELFRTYAFNEHLVSLLAISAEFCRGVQERQSLSLFTASTPALQSGSAMFANYGANDDEAWVEAALINKKHLLPQVSS